MASAAGRRLNWNDIASVAVTLFLIMDPLGNAPVINAVLARIDERRRARIVARECVIALVVLFAMLMAGNAILKFLGLSESSLNITGGVLLFIISLRMIFPGKSDPADTEQQEDPFIVPLAVPLIAGPSSIAVLLLLSSKYPERLLDWLLALFLAWLGTTVLLVASPRLLTAIGRKGARALERFMGMVLVMIAIQMLLNGIRDFLLSL